MSCLPTSAAFISLQFWSLLLHSTAGGGLKGAHNGLVHASQDAGMWKLIATNSWPCEEGDVFNWFDFGHPEYLHHDGGHFILLRLLSEGWMSRVFVWFSRLPLSGIEDLSKNKLLARRGRFGKKAQFFRVFYSRHPSLSCRRIWYSGNELGEFTWKIRGISLASARITSPWVTDRTWNTWASWQLTIWTTKSIAL